VDKGSRQNGSVTSGKGLALRIGPVGPGCAALDAVRAAGCRKVSCGTDGGRRRGGSGGCLVGQLIGQSLCWQSTIDSEPVRTRGIRLFN
jgi:hypothetical protein